MVNCVDRGPKKRSFLYRNRNIFPNNPQNLKRKNSASVRPLRPHFHASAQSSFRLFGYIDGLRIVDILRFQRTIFYQKWTH